MRIQAYGSGTTLAKSSASADDKEKVMDRFLAGRSDAVWMTKLLVGQHGVVSVAGEFEQIVAVSCK
jgi:hypothetical protein